MITRACVGIVCLYGYVPDNACLYGYIHMNITELNAI